VIIRIDCNGDQRTLDPFWRATGFTPAVNLLKPIYRRQMAVIGSLPRRGIEHVRIHNLLNLVRAPGLIEGRPRYDWSDLDRAIDALTDNRLKPFFELMGNPDDAFDDFNAMPQLQAWRRLIGDLVGHLADRYGSAEVASWWFETWNEPDCDTWWPQFYHDPAALTRYYDACAAGLADAGLAVRFGGPGGQGGINPVTRALLEHLDRGRCALTGDAARRPDFISFHEKGAPFTAEQVMPDADGLMHRTGQFLHHVRRTCPNLAGVPVMNSECDPQIGWNRPQGWRAGAYYPAFAAHMIHRYQSELIDRDQPCAMLLNDNAFVGRWGQRSLTAWLGPEQDEESRGFDLLPKPIFHLMHMLARMGKTRCETTPAWDDAGRIGCLAAREGPTLTVLIHHHGRHVWRDAPRPIELCIENLPFDNGWLMRETLFDPADGRGDAFALWGRMGAPAELTEDQLAALTAAAAVPTRRAACPIVARHGRLRLTFQLPCPAVTWAAIVPSVDRAAAPTGLHAQPGRDATNRPVQQLQWQAGDELTIDHYRVEVGDSPTGPFEPTHAPAARFGYGQLPFSQSRGYWRVRAVGWNGLAGPASPPVEDAPRDDG